LEISMTYDELIARALKGRSVNSAAKAWGVKQQNLDRWVKGMSMPNYNTALKMAREAGIDPAVAFEVFAEQEKAREVGNFKLQMGFVRTEIVSGLALAAMTVNLFLTPTPAKATPHPIKQATAESAHSLYYVKPSPMFKLFMSCAGVRSQPTEI
jgi:hypothetical protein